MKHVFKVLWKIFVLQFYRYNSGLFLLLFFALFGLVSPGMLVYYHISLMMGLVSSPVTVALISLLWLLYAMKGVAFVGQQLRKEEHFFLHQLPALSSRQMKSVLLAVQVLIHFPVLLYALLTAAVAFYYGQFAEGGMLIAGQLLICFWSSRLMFRQWRFFEFEDKTHWTEKFSFRWPKNYWTLLLAFTAHKKKFILFAVKVLSFLCIHLLLALSDSKLEESDVAVMFLFIAQLHSFLVYYYQEFLERKMKFLRALPESLLKRVFLYLVTYFILFLPEMFLLLFRSELSLLTILTACILACGQLLLMTGLLYRVALRMKVYLRWVTGLFLVFLFLTIIRPEVSIVVEFLLAGTLFYRGYYRYELTD